MKVARESALSIGFTAVIAITMLAPALRAELSNEGRFKLPFDAELGKTALPRGDYTFSLDRSAGSYGTIVIYRDSQALAIAVPETLDRYDRQGVHPELLFLRHDGRVILRALRMPNLGTFYFPIPKDLKKFVEQEPQLIETVPVQMKCS
jgi:hypothetical protein